VHAYYDLPFNAPHVGTLRWHEPMPVISDITVKLQVTPGRLQLVRQAGIHQRV
jgi:hypothetical protein